MKKRKKLLKAILSIVIILNMSGCTIDFAEKQEKFTTTTEFNITMEEKETELTTELVTEITTTEPVFYDDESIICTTCNLNLRKDKNIDSDVITVIDKYNTLEKIKTNGVSDYVNYNGVKGYVSSKYTKELTTTYVEVDISDQELKLYKDNEMILKCDVVTGMKNKYDTRYGCNPIYVHEENKVLNGDPSDPYSVYVYYWMGFDGGQGIHDADNWRHGNYGDNIYETNGSHGCVSVCYSDAEFIYENTQDGDYVLVHE